MEKIKYSAYKYAPETARATVNGQPVTLQGSAAPLQICTGQHAEAIKTIKRLYRQENAKEARFLYAFKDANTSKFYYISTLYFKASDDINTRLYNYKELKKYLKENPPTYTTESGHITPAGATTPTIKTEAAQINFNKLLIVKIA